MKLCKKLFAWILIVCILSSLYIPANAQESYNTSTLSVEGTSAHAGETVEVNVVMHNNPGIVSMQLDVYYDNSVFTLVSVTDGGLIGSDAHSDDYTLCPYRLTWVNDLATTNYADSGTIVTLTFAVSENAEVGQYPISVNYTKNNFEIYDCDGKEVDFDPVPGSLNITCSHSLDGVPAHPATCDKDGNNALYTCNLCNKVFKADGVTETTMEAERIPALGHDMAAATCTKPAMCKREGCGYTEGEVPGHAYKAEWEKNEKGHWHICNVCDEPGEVVAHVPGAEATEYTDQTCTVCGYVITPALGHTHATTKVEGFAATCTEGGQKAYYTCPCGKWFEDAAATVEIADHTSVAIAALGHDMAPATCTEAAKCQREGCAYTEGEALGHNWVDATCQASKHCGRCSLTEGEALPHTEGEWQLDAKEHWKTCASCEAELEATRQAHTDADADGICDICALTIPVQDPENPSTGDMVKPWMLVCIMALSIFCATALVLTRKRRSW